jgi:hypothetical protein
MPPAPYGGFYEVDASSRPCRATGTQPRQDVQQFRTQASRKAPVLTIKVGDERSFVADLCGLAFTPHVTQNNRRQRSATDARTTRHGGHAVSMRSRKRIKEPFSWIRTIGGGASCAIAADNATGPGSASSPPHLHPHHRLGHPSPPEQHRTIGALAQRHPEPRARRSDRPEPAQQPIAETA